MTKTLADMTPEERAECVGMWFLDPALGMLIYAGVDESNDHVFMQPTEPNYHWDKRLLQATPRTDLPRAWNPDGTPLQAARETQPPNTAHHTASAEPH